MKNGYKWIFTGVSSYGKGFAYTITANDKQTAIKKGFERLKRDTQESSIHWTCYLKRPF